MGGMLGPVRGSLSLPEPRRPRQLPMMPQSALNWSPMPVLEVEQRDGSLRIRVRVKPRASKSRILQVRGGELEIALAAPPVDGEANSELIRTLAHALGCGKSALEIVSGARSRSKLVAIVGLTLTSVELVAKLDRAGT